MHPKISIITATYNSAKTLEQTISSVVNQTYDNIEYIVIDGGSTDGTVGILEEYDTQIAYWGTEPDEGIYDAFNKGIMHATGNYIYFLGADDCLCAASTIENIVKELCADDIDVLSAAVWLVDENYGIQKLESGRKAEREDYDFSMIPHQGMFVRREILMQHPFDTSYRIAADYLFFLKCFFDKNIRFKYTNMPVAFFSIDGTSGGKVDLLDRENAKIRMIFGLPAQPVNMYKVAIKEFLHKLYVFNFLRYVINCYVRKSWQIHHCKWNVCRWCERKLHRS